MNEKAVIQAILQIVTVVTELEEATDALLRSIPAEILQEVLTQEDDADE